jgi:hypothetical protein
MTGYAAALASYRNCSASAACTLTVLAGLSLPLMATGFRSGFCGDMKGSLGTALFCDDTY